MIACVSPDLTVRSTPRRISLTPFSISTVTVRPRISKVDIGSALQVLRAGDGDVHVVTVDLDGVDSDRDRGGRPGGLAGDHVEARAVQPALERAAVELALRQRHVGVGAGVVDGVDMAV